MEIDKNTWAYKAASTYVNFLTAIAMPPLLAMFQMLPWMVGAALFWNFNFFLTNALGILVMPIAFSISVSILFMHRNPILLIWNWMCNLPMTIAGVILCWTGDEDRMIEFLKVAYPFIGK